MIAHEEIVTCLHKVRQPFNVNRMAQIAAREALKHSDKIRARIDENREQMAYVREEMQKLGFTVPPSQTNFLLAVPPPDSGDIIERLMDRGIIVRGMRPFGLGGGTFRVTIGTREENITFINKLKELR
jgi:histidinol-phosphate aminotransferase